jgi:hypothetical protein
MPHVWKTASDEGWHAASDRVDLAAAVDEEDANILEWRRGHSGSRHA